MLRAHSCRATDAGVGSDGIPIRGEGAGQSGQRIGSPLEKSHSHGRAGERIDDADAEASRFTLARTPAHPLIRVDAGRVA